MKGTLIKFLSSFDLPYHTQLCYFHLVCHLIQFTLTQVSCAASYTKPTSNEG